MPAESRDVARYDTLSQVFHWVAAVAVTVAFVLGPDHFGRLMRDGLDPATRPDIVWHETLGVSVFVLTVLRLLWVALRPAAPRPAMAGWMRAVSKAVQGLLWLLMLALPATAMLVLGGEGHPLTLLGGVRVEHLPLVAGSALAGLTDWGDVHKFLGDAVMVLAGTHAAAAILHHWVLKDGVLVSMLPGRRG